MSEAPTPLEGRIVFLDIDGCLTATDDGTSWLCKDESTYGLSEKRLALLARLLEKTGAKVVVTSNWRRFPDDGSCTIRGCRFRNHLPQLREWLGDRYLGDMPPYRGTKAAVMEKWGEERGIDFKSLNFVIFDDDYDEGFSYTPLFATNYVHCSPFTGITESEYDVALALFENHDSMSNASGDNDAR